MLLYRRDISSVLTISMVMVLHVLLSFSEASGENSQRTIVDQTGREVVLPVTVHRVVSTYRPGTMILYALEAFRSFDVVSSDERAFSLIRLLNPGLKPVLTIGSKKSGVNIEAILSLKPDIVILYPSIDGRAAANKLEKLDVAAVVIDPESPGKLQASIQLLGSILGLREKTKRLIGRFEAIERLIAERTALVSKSDRKKVYFAASRGIYTTASKDMLQHSMIEKAGGLTLPGSSTGGWLTVSAEQLLVWNPDIIVLSRTSTTTFADLKQDPRLSFVSAVKTGRIYRFPSNIEPWDYPSAETILGMLWLAVRCYPEQFADIDLGAFVEEYFRDTYGRGFAELGGSFEDTDGSE